MPSRAFLAFVAVSALALVAAAQPKGPPRDESATPTPASSSAASAADAPLSTPATPASADSATSPAPPKRAPEVGNCPRGMVLIDGDECSEVEQPCLEWAVEPNGGEQMRCLHFGESRCTGRLTRARFCIDRYEYPNQKGGLPVVMKSWDQATSLCAERGRRLCKGAEWTLACEGEERLPYPYGFDRDANACNIDRPLSGPFPRWFEHQPKGISVSLVDWRARSGEMTQCTSPFGVHDMTGNVDEWVINESGHPFASGLKGGYWGPVRDRCRPMTVAHDERFSFYQIGFRCCEDEPRAAKPKASPGAR